MKMLLLFVGVAFFLVATATVQEDEQFNKLLKLKALREAGVLTEEEYGRRKEELVDEFLGSSVEKQAPSYRIVQNVNVQNVSAANWTMPKVYTPQIDWLISVFSNNMPRSYDDTLPATGKSYWRSHTYLTDGAMNYNGTRLPLDSEIAIQERALTHVGLNLYDGGVWAVALTLNGLVEVVDAYHRNVLYTSSTGSNPQVNGLKSIRAWEPNPDPVHPPDLFYYGRDKVANTDLSMVTLPNNLSFVMFKDGCACPSSGCCAQIGKKQIPGNFFYRMIGPTYLMADPLEGMYNFNWRAVPIGTNPDKAQWWNGAGVIHWNDWKPITGENVWGGILAPMQVVLLRNCTHVKKFAKFEDAPPEVQLAVSLMPAAMALQSGLGSMYHCPKGTKMFPPDPSEETNVSNENNFSAWAAFKALYFVLDTWYTGGDETLDKAKSNTKSLIDGLDHWFSQYLLPAKIDNETVVSQGGHVTFDDVYHYQKGDQAFAVDCQTWGMLVYGSKKFDTNYASKGQTAYGIWQAVKKLAGYYVNGQIAGVGYTTTVFKNGTLAKPDIWSGEWTWGAVFMTRKLAYEYKAKNPAWSASLEADSISMVKLMNMTAKTGQDGVWNGGGLVQVDGSFLYANRRFFIPWGWYANPLGATSSTGWAVFNEWNYDPFTLGGYFPDSTFWTQQCKENPPDKAILTKLQKFYDY